MLDRLTRGDRVAAAGALVLVIALWLPWYGIDFQGQLGDNVFAQQLQERARGLSAFASFEVIDIVLLLIGVAVIAVLFLMANGNLDDSLRSWLETVGSLAAAIIVFRIFFQPSPAQFVNVRYGMIVGLLGALAIGVGGFLNRKEGVV